LVLWYLASQTSISLSIRVFGDMPQPQESKDQQKIRNRRHTDPEKASYGWVLEWLSSTRASSLSLTRSRGRWGPPTKPSPLPSCELLGVSVTSVSLHGGRVQRGRRCFCDLGINQGLFHISTSPTTTLHTPPVPSHLPHRIHMPRPSTTYGISHPTPPLAPTTPSSNFTLSLRFSFPTPALGAFFSNPSLFLILLPHPPTTCSRTVLYCLFRYNALTNQIAIVVLSTVSSSVSCCFTRAPN